MALSLPKRLKAAWQVLTHRADAVSDLRHPTAWLTSWALGARTTSGVDVSPDGAMALAAYWACIRSISEDVGKLPLITYGRIEPRGKRREIQHPCYSLLHDAPNQDMSAMSFRETLTGWALGWGNGYAEIVRNSRGRVTSLYPIHPSRVVIKRDEQGELVYDVRSEQQLLIEGNRSFAIVRLRQPDMLHLRGPGNAYYGYSVAQLGAESLGLSLAAQTFGASFFGNGTHVSGVLKHPGELGDKALEHLRESWQELYQGPEQAHKPAILEEGMEWQALSIPPEQAQFLQTREFQIAEVARWFRMPPHKIQHLANATYTNIEHQALEYVVDTLQPWLVRWEQELKRKLFSKEPNTFAEHLVLGLLRGDQATRSAYYRERFYLGTLSPNDIRELENENPIQQPAADAYYLQTALLPIEQIGQQAQARPANTRMTAILPTEEALNGHTNGATQND